MKIVLTLIILLINIICFAADTMQLDENYLSAKKNKSSYVCDTYENCIKLGLEERDNKKGSVLLYYSGSSKEKKYNLFENLSVKFSPNVCPPIVYVYKSVNNINFLMEVFKKSNNNSECMSFYSNITGEGKNRDSIVGQLEVYYCNEDVLYETCDNGIVYSKMNMFEAGKNNKNNKDNNSGLLNQNP